MTVAEIEAALARALPMRTPRFDPDTPPRAKISALEDYLMDAAYINGELYEAAHWLNLLVDDYKTQIEQMDGYEVALGKQPARATQAEILIAKRKMNPSVFEVATHARQLRDSILAQITRFAGEEKVISRAYTLISGT